MADALSLQRYETERPGEDMAWRRGDERFFPQRGGAPAVDGVTCVRTGGENPTSVQPGSAAGCWTATTPSVSAQPGGGAKSKAPQAMANTCRNVPPVDRLRMQSPRLADCPRSLPAWRPDADHSSFAGAGGRCAAIFFACCAK